MRKIHVLVEGQTEETFVQKVLHPHFWPKGIFLQAKVAVTKRPKSGGHFKGGVVSYEQIKGDLRRLLGDTSARCVTTMLDYYALPADFPGQRSKPDAGYRARVAHLEAAFAADIGDSRFVPHLVLHEFEALIFADPGACVNLFADKIVRRLVSIRDSFASPEEIDEGPDTAPSKRLQREFPAYQKFLHGPLATGAIGLDRIRASCPHFDAWLHALEALAHTV